MAIDQLKRAVEREHGGTATFRQAVPVQVTFAGEAKWEGEVAVFTLVGHPTATGAYAWSSPIEGSSKRRFYAVLHKWPVVGPVEAVRAAIGEEPKATGR
jgi:hypothetical protein